MSVEKIETAPKDKKIMVYNSMTGWYFSKFNDGNWPMHGWDGMPGIWYPGPTHWLPEPKAPNNTFKKMMADASKEIEKIRKQIDG